MNAAPVFPAVDNTLPRSGLVYLRQHVAAYFLENAVPATVPPVGLKYRSFILNQAAPGGAGRVCFIPGEFSGGLTVGPRRYGNLSRNTRNHAQVVNPRELALWEKPFTISIWSPPLPGMANNEEDSIANSENLLELTVRAVHAAQAADIVWGAVTINAPPVENAFGTELLVSALQRGPIFDATLDYVIPKSVLPRGKVT